MGKFKQMVASANHPRIFHVSKTRLQTIHETPCGIVHDRAIPGTRSHRSRFPADLRTTVQRNVLAKQCLRPDFDAPALSFNPCDER
jgi:hypothetical protein